MTSRTAPDRQLARLRPADPSGPELRAASVRVLARVAMLEAGAKAAPLPRGVRPWPVVLGRIAATLACAFLLTQVLAPRPPLSAEAIVPTTSVGALPPATSSWIEDAIAGRPLARRKVLAGGPSVRLELLDHALRHDEGAGDVLALVRATGGLRDDREAARIARLALRTDVRRPALDLLASAPTTAGVRHLRRLLLERPEAEADVVTALARAADRGRRQTALSALAAGAARGRRLAAAEALRRAQGRDVDRLVAGISPSLLRAPRFVAALRDAPATTHARLLRRARAGDERSLRLAVEARLKGVVPLLRARARTEDEAVASRAVRDLVRQHRAEAWSAIAASLDAGGDAAARAALRSAPGWVTVTFERVAAEDPRRRRVALAGLAACGPSGLLALERLTTRPALLGPVLDELALTPGDGAVDLLTDLAVAGRGADRAIVLLGERLAAGEERAARALLAVVREASSRQALRRLLEHADCLPGPWLERAATDASLPASARDALRRVLRRLASSPDGSVPAAVA